MTLNVLLIDDDARLLQTLARNLELAGYHPLTAREGQAGIDLYAQTRPDVVMLDLRMPDMRGDAVLKAIRQRDPQAEIILVTAYGEREEIVAGLRLGASDFILKPVEQAAVERALQRAEARIALRQELEATQTALRESEARFRIALKSSPIIVAHTDRDLRYTWVYKAFPGFDVDAMLGRRDDALLDFKGARALMALKRRVLASGESTRDEVTVRFGADTVVYDVTVDPLRDAGGDIVGVTTAAVDITARKATEEALRRERDLLDRLMETSPLGITVVDRTGKITFANGPAEQILGLTRDEITTRTYNDPGWQITDAQGEPLPDTALPFARVMASGEPIYDARHAITWAQGRRVLLSMHGSPLTDAHGELDGVVFTLDDVTERAREEQRRIEELERELRALSILAAAPATSITAQMFGVQSLKALFPTLFEEMCQHYGDILDQTLEQRLYKVEYATSDALRLLAQRLGNLQAGPRDVVEVHTRVLQDKRAQANAIKARAYVTEGRLAALELMGYLASYYRGRCVYTREKGTGKGEENDRISS